MTGRNVLFLALGGDRQRVVIQDAARVVAEGGRAVVVIDDVSVWPTPRRFSSRVRVLELAALQEAAMPAKVARKVLYRLPRRLFGLAGRLPLLSWSARVGTAYEKRVAQVIDERLFTPTYRWLRGDNRHRLVRRLVLRKTAFDVVVVCDPPSIPLAARLAERRSVAERITYDLAGHRPLDDEPAAAPHR
ncbi:hypothetical protein [Micromonospora sp. HK10]|uniref:hypothetical protein n=1 Tax=Micromonospora sp. HK10 TaxID=1538294 RepID=UPI0006271565|nr:hypothetical protein [Micromonospora sp. HK10]KKK05400.1 hypothetical protein LQ51_13760 [Micromonospora sp. HK10]